MKTYNFVLSVLLVMTTSLAGAAERSCLEFPASGDPGDAGSGLKVTIQLSIPDEEDINLSFDVGTTCETWKRKAADDDHDDDAGEDFHWHYNAADNTAFADGTFRWTEYGPQLTLEDIGELCASQQRGTTKLATTSDLCQDHSGILISVSDVVEP